MEALRKMKYINFENKKELRKHFQHLIERNSIIAMRSKGKISISSYLA